MLVVHRSERADCLADALGGLLAAPVADPVAAEVVAVPTRGVERWLTQRLSHHLGAEAGRGDGVCANLDFPFPAALLARALAGVTGVDPDADPWRPERCVWPLIELIDAHAGDPVLAPLVGHLRAATPPDLSGRPGPLRRLAMARHIADLYDRYAIHRPELLLGWLDDRDGATRGWQPHLWRMLRRRIGTPGPAERMEEATVRLRTEPGLVDLPERVSVFGLTRLPASHLELLSALAEGRDVHLFLLHPSPALWDLTAGAGVTAPLPSRSEDPTARLAVHPLLRSWGRDAREMQLVLASMGRAGGRHHPVPAHPYRPGGLLQTIQADIRADRRPGDAGRAPLDPADTSLRIYSCHGRARQVEVLRDALLHLLQSDPTLEPRDVVVMCPDIDAFAPLIQAAFGVDPGSGTPGADDSDSPGHLPRIRVRLADRSLRQTNPLLAVAAGLLELAGSRVTAPDVLDLAARPAVSRRFRFDRDELSTLERWVAGVGVRWGVDPAHRRRWELDRVGDNTWSAGLDRLILGMAMADDGCRVYAGTVPFDDMPSSALDLAGRAAEFLARLERALDRLAGPQPVADWLAALADAVAVLAEGAPGEDWQRDQLERVLAETAEAVPTAAASGAERTAGPDLTLEEIRSLLSERLQGRPTRANFRTGDLTVCTLVPMRSVPHRVVALLGLDDGTFPRQPSLDGDDLLSDSPRVGDRDPRSEDRQLLLDAVLAAVDHLVITYSGRDERTNRLRPPCAPVAELLDVIDATFEGRARDHVVVSHPLQTFDRRNFQPGALGGVGPWSFDRVSLAGALASSSQTAAPPWLATSLPAAGEAVVHLDRLVAFVQHPVRAFLRTCLGLYLTGRDDDLDDELPLELGPLEKWAVGDRLLAAVISGIPLERAVVAERLRGFLPPGAIADPILSDICSDVTGLHRVLEARGLLSVGAESLEVRVDLPGGRSLIGTVPGVRAGVITQCNYSRLGPKHRLAAWVRFLALTADRPDGGYGAVTVGRGTGRESVAVARLEPVSGSGEARRTWALERLAVLVDLYDRGMREPLPLCCRTSAAWVQGRGRGEGDDQLQNRMAGQWVSNDQFPGEQDDPEHLEVWGPGTTVSMLLGTAPAPDETGPGWTDETSRFAVLARRLWDPLLEHESLEDR